MFLGYCTSRVSLTISQGHFHSVHFMILNSMLGISFIHVHHLRSLLKATECIQVRANFKENLFIYFYQLKIFFSCHWLLGCMDP